MPPIALLKKVLRIITALPRSSRVFNARFAKSLLYRQQHVQCLTSVAWILCGKNTAEALKPTEDKKVGKWKASANRNSIWKAKKERKAKKDANRPKRPPGTFFVFLEEFRATFKREHPNVKAILVVGKATGEKWKSMSMDDEASAETKVAKRKADYEKRMNLYNKKQVNKHCFALLLDLLD
ncbi:high mobility group B protein 1-like [Durio zibethinus]|uniref:High mobility group B protein 1-like n=1 Tax=Durio zibethinus TaxID=66656 RepID=A0A6P5Z599_DURZI|nr:high mobility group B protein 1-like [Durio zibethinus]